MLKLLAIIIVSVGLVGCGSYRGFTRIEISAGTFEAQCGPFNHFEGTEVEAEFERDCLITTKDENDSLTSGRYTSTSGRVVGFQDN